MKLFVLGNSITKTRSGRITNFYNVVPSFPIPLLELKGILSESGQSYLITKKLLKKIRNERKIGNVPIELQYIRTDNQDTEEQLQD